MALQGSERKVLHAILREQGDAQAGYVDDSKVAEITYLSVEEVRDCLETLEGKECVQRSLGVGGFSAYATAKGRQELRRSPIVSGEEGTEQPLKIVPKGLRSFDAEDKDFFLELLPGPRRGDGLPESVHFWKVRIEEMDSDKTFRVGYIFGPSGCGKSSLVKAGLVPRLSKPIISIYIEATGEETEARLLRGLRKQYPDLPADLDLRTALVAARERIREGSNKILLVIDQFEQWYHAKGGVPETELATALRECDGGRVQAIILVRDDFSMALHRFMAVIGVRQNQDQNFAVVDLFDLDHARKVLIAFGRGYGKLPDDLKEMTGAQNEFLDRTITGLSQEGRVISVRLALFAEMLKGKPWTPETLKQVGGAEGVGVTFLEETFSARTAPPSYRIHQKAVQAVLRVLLPETGSNIKGNMRSHKELLEASGYGSRPIEFDELLRILNSELRLISPTEPEGSESDSQPKIQVVDKFFLLTHDYLVPSIRNWLTRKQKETRRGRAELRLAERSSLWNAKPENRHLPSALEWANIRLLTRKKDWTGPQRKMMNRAGWVHGVRGVLTFALLSAGLLAGTTVRRQVVENQRASHAESLVQGVLDADTTQVPDIVGRMREYRRWVNSSLRSELKKWSDGSRQKLHASLALLPVDASQVDYLFNRLLKATPSELPVLRDALKENHRTTLTPKLWTVLESAKPGDASLLPVASALARYAPDDGKWEAVGGKVSQALVSVNPVFLGDWLDALHPVRLSLTAPLAAIFRDKDRPETERSLAINILTNYADDDPNIVANLLMDADPKAYAAFFPIAQRQEAKALPLFQAEIARTLAPTWNDPPLDPSWRKPDAILKGKFDSAQGMLSERLAFCQTMPLDEFVTTAEALRPSGYRPTRLRPYADGKNVLVAAVWTRDGRLWKFAHNQSALDIRQTDEQNRKAGFLPVDVAGYRATAADGKSTDRFAALWVEKASPQGDARMVVAVSPAELQAQPAGMVPLTLRVWRQADDKLSYCGVWHKTEKEVSGKPSLRTGLAEGDLPGVIAQQSGSLIDLDVSAAPPLPSPKERATTALAVAEAAVKAKPDNLNARFDRASAHFQLGENQKAIDDLNALIEKAPQFILVYKSRALAHARLGHKEKALADQGRFQWGDSEMSPRLYLAVIVAAELGDGVDQAFEKLDRALKTQPQDAGLHYDAACAYALASQAVARKDRARSKSLSERALSLLRTAIQNGYSDYKHMQEDADLDPLRELPAFADILKPGHLERSYAAVWSGESGEEAVTRVGLDPAAHLLRCRELASQGYRMVALSVAWISPEAPPITASVWHRPVITEETKDRLAERQARAAIALLRMGKAGEIMPLLRHSADPRLRSFIVNWLSPLGADPKILASELEHIDPSVQPPHAEPPKAMDAILFHPETSMRRALILALGTYGTEGLSLAEREPLTIKLLDLYRNDPDSGIHGAAAWILRQWKQQESLKAVDTELSKLKDRGDRRWFVNGQGQTFAVIEGPVEFLMGSPSANRDRGIDEVPRRVIIPRRFAIADREVTGEQYQHFMKYQPQIGFDPSEQAPYSPDTGGPLNKVFWCEAAAYCNWLSEQEGLPKDQWCYLPNKGGAYFAWMTIPADVLKRTGYRLPTDAEWEYACRSGTITSCYYGDSIDLLGKYAWYRSNSRNHAWLGGSLLPNELGLFDMLGNVWEWVQDRFERIEKTNDEVMIPEALDITRSRLFRGGSYSSAPAGVQSANRGGDIPTVRQIYFGFRPSRTYP